MNDTQIILNFHGIGKPHSAVDSAELPYWITETFFLSILDLIARRTGTKRVVFTFDDGNASDLSIAATNLSARQQSGIFFVLTGRFEDPNYLSTSDVKALIGMGMEVGLHGRDHVDWRKIPRDRLNNETVGARDILIDVGQRPVTSVAIPFGAYNRLVISHLKKCGFQTIYTSDGGSARNGERIRNRTSIRSDMTLDDVNRILDDNVPWQKRMRRLVSTSLRRFIT